jgi:hypothetical protein
MHVCGYGSGFNGVLQREPHVSQQRLFQGPLLAIMIAVGSSDPCSTSPKLGLVVPLEAVLTAY